MNTLTLRILFGVTALALSSTLASAKGTPSLKVLTERCTNEANDAGMVDEDEVQEYVKECVKDLLDMSKQGIDIDGSGSEEAGTPAAPKAPKKATRK